MTEEQIVTSCKAMIKRILIIQRNVIEEKGIEKALLYKELNININDLFLTISDVISYFDHSEKNRLFDNLEKRLQFLEGVFND